MGKVEGDGWRTARCLTPADLPGNSRKLKATAKENLKLKTRPGDRLSLKWVLETMGGEKKVLRDMGVARHMFKELQPCSQQLKIELVMTHRGEKQDQTVPT